MGDGFGVVFVARATGVEIGVETARAFRPAVHRLQTQGDAIVGEGDPHPTLVASTREIARRVDPQRLEGVQRPGGLDPGPILVGKEMGQPQHNAQSKILVDVEGGVPRLAQLANLGDQPTVSWLSLAAGLCLAATLIVFFVRIWPANQDTDNWASTPPDWSTLRKRWEYGHLVNAILTLVALCLIVAGALVGDSAG